MWGTAGFRWFAPMSPPVGTLVHESLAEFKFIEVASLDGGQSCAIDMVQ